MARLATRRAAMLQFEKGC